MAQQLASVAPPDTILVSDTTARLVHSVVQMTPYTPAAWPVKPRPLLVTHALSPRVRRARTQQQWQRRSSRLVGRQQELAALLALGAHVLRGRGHVVNLIGEAGMGKSHLLAAFRRAMQPRPVTYLTSACVSYGQTTACFPLAALLRQVCGLPEDPTAARLRVTLQRRLQALGLEETVWMPPLLQLLEGPHASHEEVSPAPPSPPSLLEALVQMVVRAGQQRPVILAVEDIQWIDATSEDYLRGLIDRIPSLPLLLVCTFRPRYQPSWMGKSYATQMALQPLTPEESQRLVYRLLRGSAARAALTAPVLAQAEGNPLFLTELAQAMRTTAPDAQPRDLPEAIHAVLAARLDHLPAAAKHLVQLAAVLGVEVPRTLLQAVSTLNAETFEHSVTYLHMVECLHELPGRCEPTYTFTQRLLRDVAYTSLAVSTRQHVHAQVAQTLVERCPVVLQTAPEQVAQHYAAAGRGLEAAPYWQQAGQAAMTRSAYPEALRYLHQGLTALACLPETPRQQQWTLRLQVTLGVTLMAVQGYGAPEVLQTYRRALALGQHLGETAWALPALRGLHLHALAHADIAQARQRGVEMLTAAQRLGEPRALMYACCTHGFTLFYAGELLEARHYLEQSLTFHPLTPSQDAAVPYSGSHPIVAILYHLTFTLWFLGYPAQALQRMQEAYTYVEAVANPMVQTIAHVFAAVGYQLRREVTAAQQQLTLALALATPHGFTFWVVLSRLLQYGVHALHTQGPARLEVITQGLAMAHTSLAHDVARPFLLAPFIEAYRHTEHLEAGLTLLRKTLATASATGVRYYEAELQRLAGELCSSHPHAETQAQAEPYLLQALHTARAQGAKALELRTALSLSRLWQRQGSRLPARELLGGCYRWFREGFEMADLVEAHTQLAALA